MHEHKLVKSTAVSTANNTFPTLLQAQHARSGSMVDPRMLLTCHGRRSFQLALAYGDPELAALLHPDFPLSAIFSSEDLEQCGVPQLQWLAAASMKQTLLATIDQALATCAEKESALLGTPKNNRCHVDMGSKSFTARDSAALIPRPSGLLHPRHNNHISGAQPKGTLDVGAEDVAMSCPVPKVTPGGLSVHQQQGQFACGTECAFGTVVITKGASNACTSTCTAGSARQGMEASAQQYSCSRGTSLQAQANSHSVGYQADLQTDSCGVDPADEIRPCGQGEQHRSCFAVNKADPFWRSESSQDLVSNTPATEQDSCSDDVSDEALGQPQLGTKLESGKNSMVALMQSKASVQLHITPRKSKLQPKSSVKICGICLDNLNQVAVEPCKHGLCATCAKELIIRMERKLLPCPFCRGDVKGIRPFTQTHSYNT